MACRSIPVYGVCSVEFRLLASIGAAVMIHQFTELGRFFLQRDKVDDELTQYTQDPAFKARGNTILVLIFTESGFDGAQIEEYDNERKLRYLYRSGPPNGFDATPTTRMPPWDPDKSGDSEAAVTKRIKRLIGSAKAALATGNELPKWELDALKVLTAMNEKNVASAVLEKYDDSKGRATVTVAWQPNGENLKYVGDFKAFRQSLIRQGRASASEKKTTGEIRGIGTCCICGHKDVGVSGLLQIPNFKFYTLDKPGSISGGFDPSLAWRNFPVCKPCSDCAGYSGERIGKELSFNYYGFKYLVLPSPVQKQAIDTFEFLGRLVNARVNSESARRLTDAENELFYAVSEEGDLLQVDLLFYQPDPNYFRPALYVAGLLPSRFQALFRAKSLVDAHPWMKPPFAKDEFTFKALRDVFPSSRNRGTYDDDFLRATRAALELRPFPEPRLLNVGMQWVRQDFAHRGEAASSLLALFRVLLFFEVLADGNPKRGDLEMQVDYGPSEQADRVRRVFSECSGILKDGATAQAAFLVGACCRRIELIQQAVRGASPFVGKYKGLRLVQGDIRNLFVAAKAKAQDYGPDEEMKVRGLLFCAGAALATLPDHWELSTDEISYFFALGHALCSRLAKDKDQSD